MSTPCPICATPVKEADMHEHLNTVHIGATEPEVLERKKQRDVKCLVCGAMLPSPEDLREHNGSVHHL